MKRAMIILIATIIATTLIPLISISQANNNVSHDKTSKEVVTIFQD